MGESIEQTILKRIKPLLDDATIETWAYVRNNANSLDSERCCAFIRQLTEKAVTGMRDLLAESERKLREANAKTMELRKDIVSLKRAARVVKENQAQEESNGHSIGRHPADLEHAERSG